MGRCEGGRAGGQRSQPACCLTPQLCALRTDAVERLSMLRTKAMREKEEQRELRKYNYTLLRVRLPDGCLLQGVWGGWPGGRSSCPPAP